MKNTLKNLPQKDMEELIKGAILANSSPARDAFWDKVDALLEQMAAKKAPKVAPRLTNSPRRGT